MGTFAQLIGALIMIAGIAIAGLGFDAASAGGVLLMLPYGVATFVSGMVITCLGVIVEHVHGLRLAQEKQLEIFQAMQVKKAG